MDTIPLKPLFVSFFLMLAFAILEFATGAYFNLKALQADGWSMFGHSGFLLLSACVALWANNTTPQKQSAIVKYTGIAMALYLLLAAWSIFWSIFFPEHHTHHHHGATSGGILFAFGAISLGVHMFVSYLLNKDKGGHALIRGPCIYVFSHTLMALAMMVGGLLMLNNNQNIDQYISIAIGTIMLLGALRIGYQSIWKTSCKCL